MILQTPGPFHDEACRETLDAARRVPTLIVGRADVIDPVILGQAGVRVRGSLQSKGFARGRVECAPLGRDLPESHVIHLPSHQPIEAVGEVLFRTQATPTLARCAHVIYWQPPDWSEPSNQFLPRYQIGSLASHVLAARTLTEAMAKAGLSHAADVAFAQPVAFHMWRSDGRVHILLGNLETGLTGDARTERRVTLHLNRRHLGIGAGEFVLREKTGEGVQPHICAPDTLCFHVRLGPEQSAVYVLWPADAPEAIRFEP